MNDRADSPAPEGNTSSNNHNGHGNLTASTQNLLPPSGDLESQRTPSPPSPTTPPGQNSEQSHPGSLAIPPANSPAVGRERGYSLRRLLLTKAFKPPTSTQEATEPTISCPSEQHLSGRPLADAKEHNEKRDATGPTVSSLERLLSQPSSKKSASDVLPDCSQWVRRQRKNEMVVKVEAAAEKAYKEFRKRILRVEEVLPSKDGRHIYLDPLRKRPRIDERTNKGYISNYIRSSRYTLWNFLPRQFLFQFAKVANFYFLAISILQMIPGLSTTGKYTTIVPLLCFVALSMMKEGYDDFCRYKLDKAENRRQTTVLKPYGFAAEGEEHWSTKSWQDVKVGDIIKLNRDDAVPADMILLHSDGPNNIAYIETMALDGETTLKAKQPSPLVSEQCRDVDSMAKCDALIVAEDPNLDLYSFDGRVTVDGKTLPLTTNEAVYRGSILRNTNNAVGMVINTGEECKIRMNANTNPRIKSPSMQRVVNQIVIMVVFTVLSIASACTIAYHFWSKDVESNSWYLHHAEVPPGNILTSFIIMFNTMIPLSLYVSLEIIKLGQLLLMNDVDMYDPVSNTPMEAHTTTINEELGQISYIFSDKTGTLTDNVMRFRKMSVAGVAWMHDFDLRQETAALPNKVTKGKGRAILRGFDSETASTQSNESTDAKHGYAGHFDSQWKSSARPVAEQPELKSYQMLEYLSKKPHGAFARKARLFLLSLALCHTCLPETKENGSVDYQAASPDELALVRAASDLGYMVVDRAAQTIMLKTYPNGPAGPEETEVYTVLDVIEFSSKRKRMTIIVRFPDGRQCVFCKGADSVVMERLKLSRIATQQKAEVERRTSVRRNMEAESVIRRRSVRQSMEEGSAIRQRSAVRQSMESESAIRHRNDAYVSSPRNSRSMDISKSFDITRANSINLPRQTSVNHRRHRDEVKSWLKERETDVDQRPFHDPNAYVTPKASIQSTLRPFTSLASNDEDYYESMVDEQLAVNEKAVFERCFQHIDDFATEGLRTLLYGYRFIDEQEYTAWKSIYHNATTNLVNRQEKIEEAAELIERDFDLAGATAIEDKLQKGVPETIDKLRRANIKMWMLTGDKRETAINIGHSCRLIKDYSKIIILDSSEEIVQQLMVDSLAEINQDSVAHSVVVIDGQTLSHIEADDTLSDLFFNLAVLADSVICCRASPSQKALLVKKIRRRVNGSVTLAIGDGANDIAMIQEAHVGIGITGKEGLQAARISDYSIAQFRFLQKLLLVHGRWNYVRTAKYVLCTFWKEMLFYLTQALYQHWNGYSGTSFYESWSLSMFNTLFTSLPVIFLGILDKDLSPATLLAVPELYTQGQRGEAFNKKKYFAWMLLSTLEAMMVYFVILGIYAWPAKGREDGIFAIGDLAFTVCVIVINIKILIIEKHKKTLLTLLAFSISILLWFLWNIVLCYTYSAKEALVYNVKGGLTRDFGKQWKWWLCGLIVVVMFVVVEVCLASMRRLLWPSDTEVFQELEQDPVLKRQFRESCRDVLGVQEEEEEGFEEQKKEEVKGLLSTPEGGAKEMAEKVEMMERGEDAEEVGPLVAGGRRGSRRWKRSSVEMPNSIRRLSARVPGSSRRASADEASPGARRGSWVLLESGRRSADVEMEVLRETETRR